MICVNVQGFINQKDEIENVLLEKYRPNIMGFTETHVTHMVVDYELEINGYVCTRGDSEFNRTGGVVLYLDNTTKYEVVERNVWERNWWSITVKVNEKNYKGIIMLMYHSPSSSDISFINFLYETCKKDLWNGR